MSQKRKRDRHAEPDKGGGGGSSSPKKARHSVSKEDEERGIDTSKPSAIFQAQGARTHTLSVALPGSIVANAKSHDQKTFLCGSIARALAVFCVDEVVIFDDGTAGSTAGGGDGGESEDANAYTGFSNPGHFLAHVLSYLETPPYLRRALFPMHPNLRTAGTLPSLDLPSHVRGNERSPYREGVVVAGAGGADQVRVDVGLPERYTLTGGGGAGVTADQLPAPQTRVTVRLDDDDARTATAVSPSTPREHDGYYWGYSVRTCGSLSNVLTECPFDGGYDVSVGTSERGQPLDQVLSAAAAAAPSSLSSYRHLLVVFGGVAGLEAAVANDAELVERGIGARNVGQRLFDYWVNLVPGQGSRTIRTEEAVWLGLMGLRPVVVRHD